MSGFATGQDNVNNTRKHNKWPSPVPLLHKMDSLRRCCIEYCLQRHLNIMLMLGWVWDRSVPSLKKNVPGCPRLFSCSSKRFFITADRDRALAVAVTPWPDGRSASGGGEAGRVPTELCENEWLDSPFPARAAEAQSKDKARWTALAAI